MLKKILICLLLLANLSTGLAFALDTHPEAMAGQNSSTIDLLADTDLDNSEGDRHQSDHSCHGAAHMMGLFSSQTTPFIDIRHTDFAALSQAPPPLYIAPLLRPPIS